MIKNKLSILLSTALVFASSLYAPQKPTGLLAVIAAATDTTAEQKKDLAVAWVKAYPDKAQGAVVKQAMTNIYGSADGLEKAIAASKVAPAPAATLPKPVSEKIDAVKGAADKKAATKAALTEIGQQIGKGIATASALSADEVGAALVAGMKK